VPEQTPTARRLPGHYAVSACGLHRRPIELIAGAAQFVPLFARGIIDDDTSAVGPDEEHLLSVAHVAPGEEADAILE